MDPSDEVAANTTSMKFCLLSSFFLKIAITLVAEWHLLGQQSPDFKNVPNAPHFTTTAAPIASMWDQLLAW